MIARSLVVLAAALTLSCASAGSLRAGADAAPNGRLLFVRGDDLYVTSADGRDVRLLTRDAEDPAVSTDGRRIAFVRDESIWVMRRDGSGQARLTSDYRDFTPAWSPDGRFLYFTRIVEGKDRLGSYEFAAPIFRMRANGTGLRQLTRPTPSDHGECDDGPAPSPDRRVIAYASIGECDRGNDPSLSAIDLVGRDVLLAGFDIRNGGFDPAWSPDGRQLAFAAIGEWGSSIGIEVATSGERRARRVYRRAASRPAWSPDGQWIAFVRGVGRGTIWLVRRDGTGLHRLSSRRYDADPAWLPPAK